MSERCTFTWRSGRLGVVQCWHQAGHDSRHEAWASRRERREWPAGSSWCARDAESLGWWAREENPT